MKKLQEITWFDEEGVFVLIERGFRNKKYKRKEDIEAKKPEPIGDSHSVVADNRTLPQIVQTIYESTLDNNPNVEIYKKINTFCANVVPEWPIEKSLDGQIIINFYHIKD